LVIKPEVKKPLSRPRHRWEDDNRMALGETGWHCMDWTYLVEDRDQWQVLVNTVMNSELLDSIKGREFLD
jgi:hypothetical protein